MILNKMKIQLEVILFLLVVLLIIFPSIISGKSVIEPCNSSDSCNALLSYLLPWDSKLSEISSRFQVNVTDILASNSLNPTISFPENQIFPANSLLKVPISCPCVDGIRRSVSTNYTVGAIDTVDSISAGYGGLVSADQIKIVNGIDDKHQLMSGMSIVIPLPCMCFNNSINGITTVFMSYVVQRGESLSSIGATYSATVTELEAVNGLLEPVVHPGDVLAVPNPACSSANLDWYNESLIVPNGSYALTANNCIMCRCGVNDKDLRCSPSSIGTSCFHLQCKGTDLFIGDIRMEQTRGGCNVTKCIYRGHLGQKIFSSLANSSQIQCSGNHSVLILPPCPPPTLHSSEIPLTNAPVSSSPSPASAYNLSDPSSRKSDNISSDSRSFRDTSYLFPPRLALLVCFVYLLSK
ncbi:lysM domain-containing GPI-anchored protein 1-like isoform X1 [Macadamia integrifolia]|uniref:lysM domain-containing GPI-anchored protein 1-like isoform X1 n=1 Tax=Macadamia integrifolia TaxID=60698 RepID=UPI001C5018AD|nr:lysM domain-containing GPI-anchored protein 1-like isoform X1 [Macadamia integrifolia]